MRVQKPAKTYTTPVCYFAYVAEYNYPTKDDPADRMTE